MNSISKASEQVKSIFNGQVKNGNQGNLRNKKLSNQVDPLDGLLPADKDRLRQREARIQREIQDIQKQLQTDIDLVKSPKVVNSGRLSNMRAQMKQTLVSAKDQIVKTVNSTDVSKIQGGLKDSFISAKEHIMGDSVHTEPLKTEKTEKTESVTSSSELMSNIGDKVKSGLVFAQDALKSSNITENLQGGFVSAKDTLLSAKDRMFGTVQPIEGGMPGRNHPHPERFAAQSSGLVSKITGNLFAVKDRFMGSSVEPMEGGMPGRNHPHPERFEVQAPGLVTKIGDIMSANSGLATKISDNFQGGLIFAKDGLSSAKDRIFGTTIQPIEGGMPGRNHPHPEQFAVQNSGLINNISTNLQGGFEFAKGGLVSAKSRIFGSTIQPIEGGMPGRNHPHPERFEDKAPGLVTKISENIPTGLISAINDNLQGGFATAKDGLLSARTKIWGPSIQPIEGGMPGRNHPHPERFEAKTGLVTKISNSIPAGFNISTINENLQGGFATAKDSFLSAKTRVWGSSIQPIEGGMPGRNHPHPERFEAKTGLVTKISDSIPTGFNMSMINENLQGGFMTAKDAVLSAKTKVWGPSIQPIEGGMPGRNHPHPERFEAKTGLVTKISDSIPTGLISSINENLQGGFATAKGAVLSAKTRVWGSSIQPIEGGMPGRNHPHPERFEAKTGFVTKISENIPTGFISAITDPLQGGFTTAKDSFLSAKTKVWGSSIQPIEGGMPGRYHPHPERFEVKSSGFVSKITENLQGGFVSAKGGLLSAKNKVWGSSIQPIEGGMPGRNHPHPERFVAKDQGIIAKLTDNVQGGFVSAKSGFVSAKNKIWGPTIQPIEGGMPGRNHPNAERFVAKDQGFVSKLTDNLQGGFVSAKGGLVSAKNKIWGQTIQPIEGGMPGRNHPHSERFEVKNPGIVAKLTDNVQGGFVSAKSGFVSAKNKIWGPTIQPIEGGMPGRNHPNAERFKAKDQGIVNKLTHNIQGGFVSAKNKIWGQTILPIESGMPGRNHPHPERFEAKNPGIVSKLADNFQGGFVSAKGGLVSAKNKIWGQNIQLIEGGMPGRNHPNAKRFEAKDSGIMSKFTGNVQGGLVSAKNKIWGPTIQPIEGGMPGRNHPNAKLFEAKNPGIVSKLTDNVQGGLISAKNKIWGPTIVSVEGGMPGRNHPHAEKFEANDDEEDETFALQPTKGSRIEKDSIDQVSPIQKTETANKNQTEPKLSKLVSESKLAELFDMEPETETEIGIVDQTALEPSSDIVEDNMEQPTEVNHAESPKPLGFFEKLKSLF